MGYIKPKGTILCQACGQIHGVNYDCRRLKLVTNEFARPVQKEILDLKPEQEIVMVMELGDVRLRRLVGGVEVSFENHGSLSYTLDHAEFFDILEYTLIDGYRPGQKDSFVGVLLICTVTAVFWLSVALFFFK